MISGILQNTPAWVWAVFIALLAFGLMQARNRRIPRILVFVLPAVMLPLSLYAVEAAFGFAPLPLSAWCIGVATAVALNQAIFQTPAGVRFVSSENKFDLPGSWLPLMLMMTIFCARFVLGVARVMNPALIGNSTFIVTVSAILGLCSGMFLARSIRILAVQRAAA
jgi:hypothetical protein